MEELTKTEETMLVSIWRLKEEAYGYALRKHISKILNKDFSYGNLYSVLGQLVKKGYVLKREGASMEQKTGKTKMYYTITKTGVGALNKTKENHNLLWDGITNVNYEEM